VSRRSSFGPTVLAGLASAAVAAVGASRTWAQATTTAQGERSVTAAGSDVAAAALPLALVALASWGAVLVLRSRGRRIVAVLGVLAAAGAAVAVVRDAGSAGDVASRMLGGASDVTVSTTVWPVVTLVACLVTLVAFAVAFVKAPSWPEMSSRYDAPADRGPGGAGETGETDPAASMTQAELWRAIDEGHDPTE